MVYLVESNGQRGWLNGDEIKTTFVTEREANALYLQRGDILMNEGGDRDKLGRGWIWDGQVPRCIHQNHVFRLRPRSADISSRYISYYANEFGQPFFLTQGKQTTNLASISLSKLSELPIPICTPAEMHLIVKRIEGAFAWIENVAAERSRAAQLLPKLDQAILAKAFRGELIPQDPNDEPAATLLARIHAEREAAEVQPKSQRMPRKTKIELPESRPVLTVLKEAAESLTPEQLFARCGRNPNDLEEVERFYAELRGLADAGLLEERRPGRATVELRFKP